jgi:hypothetical protein
MNLTVVVLLVALWAVILAPALFRGRPGRSPAATIDSFERSMGILASERFSAPRVPGRQVMVVHDPRRLTGRSSRARTLRRRRRVLQCLTLAVVGTGLAAVLAGPTFAPAFAGAAGVLAAYVALLLFLRGAERRSRRVVRRITVADAPRARPVSARRIADRIA